MEDHVISSPSVPSARSLIAIFFTRLALVIFFDSGVPDGSSTIASMSVDATLVSSASAEILVSAIIHSTP